MELTLKKVSMKKQTDSVAQDKSNSGLIFKINVAFMLKLVQVPIFIFNMIVGFIKLRISILTFSQG